MYIFAEVSALILDIVFAKEKKVQCRVSMYIDCRACNRHNVINSSKIIKVIFGTSFGAPKNEPKHCNCI